MADDFDRELEEAARQAQARKSIPAPKAAPDSQQASAGEKTEAPAGRAQRSEPSQPARAMSARKPGLFGRMAQSVSDSLAHLRMPRFEWATLGYILLGLLIFILLAQNWAPVRINIFGLYIDVPKAVAFVVNIGIGMLVLWLVQRWLSARRHQQARQGGRPA